MSGRQIKKLLGGNTLPLPADDSDEDFEPLYAKNSPSKFKYQGLVISSDSDNESNSTLEIEPPEPKKLAKKKKKKKKQQKVKQSTKELNNGPELDEIDRSVMEVNAILGSPPPLASAVNATTGQGGGVMAVQLKHLNNANELRRMFGPEEEDERNIRRARVPTVLLKKWVIVPMGDNNGLRYRQYGLSMSVDRIEDGCTYFTFDHSEEYQKVHRRFLRLVGSARAAPAPPAGHARRSLHVDTLLQAADVMFRMEDYTGANTLIEQAIAFMQSVAHPTFNLADSKVRLEYKVLENRPFHVALLKYLHLLTNRACHRTALELAKLLLNLDPSDPLAVLLLVDALALRAREHAWLIDAIDHWTQERDAGFLFNMQYSYAMAHFHVAKKVKGDLSHADQLLEKAILSFPLVAVKIFEYANVKLSARAKSSALFNSVAETATTNLKDLINLYAKFVWAKWREPPVMEWLSRAADRLAERYERDHALQDQVKVWTNERLNLFQRWPEQISRHLLVIKPMSGLLVDGQAVPSVEEHGGAGAVASDPAPPPPAASVNRYGYRLRTTPPLLPADRHSVFVQLFHSILPDYNIIGIGGDEEQNLGELDDGENVRQMQLLVGLIDSDNEGGASDSEDEFELQPGEAARAPGEPADLIVSIGDLARAVHRFMTVFEPGNDPAPDAPPPEDQQNQNPENNDH